MKNKENIPLIIGIALPLLMIVFVAASIYVPRWFTDPPQYDFLYSNADYYRLDYDYEVVDGRLIKIYSATDRDISESDLLIIEEEAVFYLHDLSENESEKISFDLASDLILDDSKESPDGYKIERGSGGGMFGNNNYNKLYIKGNGSSRKLDLERGTGYRYYDFNFIGWITE